MKLQSRLKLKLIGFGILLNFSNFALAIETSPYQRLISIVKDAIAVHPLVQSAQQKMNQARANAKASKQPLYNPDISIDYESNVDNISTVGLSQTIDWSDKRATLSQIGLQKEAAVKAEFVLIRQQVAADFLKKINLFHTTRKASALNSQQIATLSQFVDIAKRRFKAGDISQIELNLALLVSGEVRMNSAKIQAQYYAADTALSALLNFRKILIPEISTSMIQSEDEVVEQLLLNHPRLKQLRLATLIAKAQIKLASRKRTADPTISLNAGKEGKANIYRVGVSMPLFVRNNFNAEVDSAIANAAAVEENYRNSYRNILVAVKSSHKTLSLTLSAYKNWVGQSQKGLQQRGQLLQKLWRSGDLSTTDYLVQIQQTLDTQIAAVRLKADVINAWIDYLSASGQIDSWLSLN